GRQAGRDRGFSQRRQLQTGLCGRARELGGPARPDRPRRRSPWALAGCRPAGAPRPARQETAPAAPEEFTHPDRALIPRPPHDFAHRLLERQKTQEIRNPSAQARPGGDDVTECWFAEQRYPDANFEERVANLPILIAREGERHGGTIRGGR